MTKQIVTRSYIYRFFHRLFPLAETIFVPLRCRVVPSLRSTTNLFFWDSISSVQLFVILFLFLFGSSLFMVQLLSSLPGFLAGDTLRRFCSFLPKLP